MQLACPNCGATKVKFNADTYKGYCEYCGSNFEAELMHKKVKQEQNVISYDEYFCSSCGAKLIADKNTAMTVCVYCGNQQILKRKMQGRFEPEGIIPFSKSKEEFILEYNKYLNKQITTEKVLNNIQILEIKGIYIPMYIYDTELDVYSRGKVNYNGKNRTKTVLYELSFQASTLVQQDASTFYDDDLIAAIEPYELNGLLPYQEGYMSGFLADKGDLSDKLLREKVEKRIIGTIPTEIEKCISEKTRISEYLYSMKGKICINIEEMKSRYYLFPLWLMQVKYKNKKYWIAMNGQTGKLAGCLPVDIKKAFVDISVLILVLIIFFIFFVYLLYTAIFIDGISDISGIVGITVVIIWIFLLIFSFVAACIASFAPRKLEKQETVRVSLNEKKNCLFKEYRKKVYYEKFGKSELDTVEKNVFRNGIDDKKRTWKRKTGSSK